MTYRPRARCKRCCTPRGLAGGLSRTGLCGPCGESVLADNIRGMVRKSGPAWEKYREGMTDYLTSLWGGDAIPDTVPASFEQLSLMEVNP